MLLDVSRLRRREMLKNERNFASLLQKMAETTPKFKPVKMPDSIEKLKQPENQELRQMKKQI